MQKTEVAFAVESKSGIVQRIGHSEIVQPKTNFKGGQMNWYEDKPKKKDN